MLQFTDLALRRGPKLLLSGVDLTIHPGHKVGITGANGSGKSSLLALVLGELLPDAGEVSLPPATVISHVAQAVPHDERPALEFVLDGDGELRHIEGDLARAESDGDGLAVARLHARLEEIGGYAAKARAAQLIHGLGFAAGDEARAVNEFSGGWRMRLNLARALMCRSDLLLLDEPTNHLDLDAVIWLEAWLRGYGGTLLLISHDREFLDAVVQSVVHLEHGRATRYPGNYSAFERVRAERLAVQQAQYEKQQREIAHMRSFVDRFRAKASKARQAQSRLKALERMELIAPAHVDSPFRFRFAMPDKTPNPLLTLERAAAGYGDEPVLEAVNLGLAPGDRIGLLGRNGAGKSTLIRLLAGTLAPCGGRRMPAQDLAVGYFAQSQLEQLDPEATPLEHLKAIDPAAKEAGLRNFLGGFGFSGDAAFMRVAPFSGGEKSRLGLALIVYRRPNLLLLDEPTNHLDLEMRQALATALQDFAGAMVIVSHDRHLLRVAADELLLVDGGRVARFDGSLEEYPAWLAGRERPARARTGAGRREREARKRQAAEVREQARPYLRQIRKAESALERLQARRAALETALAEPGLYAPGRKEELLRLLAEKGDIEWELAREEAAWLEASEALEALGPEA